MSDKDRAFENPNPGTNYLLPGPQSGMPSTGTLRVPAEATAVSPSQLGPSSMDPYSTTMSDHGQEGYDYAFEPSLESKYECPICLMCLREPVQTECGHRFCRNCITRSLRDASQRCPVDNKPLTEQRVFADVCVNREILDLKAHCPYPDCPDIIELRNMEVHEENCIFGTLMCPQNCGVQLRRKSLETHKHKSCPKRGVRCDHCTAAIPLDELQFHTDSCFKAPAQCNHCGESMLRELLQYHLKTNCPQVVVDCRYKKVGCMERMERQLMAEHLQNDMQLHMDLLASRFDQLQIPAGNPFYGQYYPTMDASLVDYSDDYPGIGATANQASMYPKEPQYGRGTALDTIAIEKYEARVLDQSMLDKSQSKYPVGGNVVSRGGRSMQGGLQRHPSNASDTTDPRLSTSDLNLELEVGLLKEKVQNLQRNIVQQNQEVIMLKANAARAQEDAKRATDRFNVLESRLCNGEFYWRLYDYSNMVREAQRGETSVRHSKGFYTSFYGYKLCLRVNVNVSESSHNSHVSLFVHFLKGEHDDLLDWPFSGKITLIIMDQNVDSSKRKHISETLLSKPELAAFHRPRTHRNHKGFGYMEFAPVSMLDSGTFIKDDTLLIRVLVEVKKS